MAGITNWFRIGKKGESPKPRPLLIKFESLETKNMVLDNSSRLKDSESINKVILSLDLSKEDREDCKKLLADKLKEVNEKGGSKKWVVRIRGQRGAFHAVAYRRRAVEWIDRTTFFVLWVTFDFDLCWIVHAQFQLFDWVVLIFIVPQRTNLTVNCQSW